MVLPFQVVLAYFPPMTRTLPPIYAVRGIGRRWYAHAPGHQPVRLEVEREVRPQGDRRPVPTPRRLHPVPRGMTFRR
jgi:hypothetical protein